MNETDLASPRSTMGQWVGGSAALALLAGRTYLREIPLDGAVVLPLLYGSLFLLSVADPAPLGRSRAHPAGVLALGLAAVALSGAVAGPAVPAAGVTAATLLLATPAAAAEEAFFRRYLYARFERWGGAVAIGATALLFAAIHVPLYGVAAFPLDLGAGVLFGWQRWASGTWTVPAATHVLANWLVILR
jgi:membrane protease YdiL (CAAX protease family)